MPESARSGCGRAIFAPGKTPDVLAVVRCIWVPSSSVYRTDAWLRSLTFQSTLNVLDRRGFERSG